VGRGVITCAIHIAKLNKMPLKKIISNYIMLARSLNSFRRTIYIDVKIFFCISVIRQKKNIN